MVSLLPAWRVGCSAPPYWRLSQSPYFWVRVRGVEESVEWDLRPRAAGAGPCSPWPVGAADPWTPWPVGAADPWSPWPVGAGDPWSLWPVGAKADVEPRDPSELPTPDPCDMLARRPTPTPDHCDPSELPTPDSCELSARRPTPELHDPSARRSTPVPRVPSAAPGSLGLLAILSDLPHPTSVRSAFLLLPIKTRAQHSTLIESGRIKHTSCFKKKCSGKLISAYNNDNTWWLAHICARFVLQMLNVIYFRDMHCKTQ